MPLLNTGLVIAGGYADKVRKTVFAQLREAVKKGEVKAQEIARSVAEINRILYHVFVERIRVEKGDVVRVRVEYDVTDGRIEWRYDTLRVEAFRRIPEGEVEGVIKEVVEHIEQVLSGVISYSVEKVIETTLGDHIFKLMIEDRHVGSLIVTPIDEGAALVKGAVTEPTPIIIDRGRLIYSGKKMEEALSSSLQDILKVARNVEMSEAIKAIEDIEAIIEKEREEKSIEEE